MKDGRKKRSKVAQKRTEWERIREFIITGGVFYNQK